MKIELQTIDDLDQALSRCARLDRSASEILAEFRDEPLEPGVSERFLRRHLGSPQCVLLEARVPASPDTADTADTADEPAGLCLTGPFADPLTDESIPMVLILHVSPDMRHRGVARALVSGALDVLRSRGQRTLAARAGHNDDALISMGERWGFIRSWELMLLE